MITATNATTEALRDAAGAAMYRRNAFRIAGLPTTADRRTIRRRQQQLAAALKIGADTGGLLGAGSDTGTPVEPEEVQAAFERLLGDPRRRLVDEIFWFWDTADADCPCPRTLHRDHDAAVTAHSTALGREGSAGELGDTELDAQERLWTEAAERWQQVLRRSAFWDHLRHRVTVLDDRQLDESAVRTLREEVPGALVRPLVELAAAATDDQGWLADQARRWPAPPRLVDDQLEEAAGPLYEAVEGAAGQAMRTVRDGAPHEAASTVREQVLPDLDRLAELVPPERHRRTQKAFDLVGTVFNNCATEVLTTTERDRYELALEWLGEARKLTEDPQTLATIDRNRETVDDMRREMGRLRQTARELVDRGRSRQARLLLSTVQQQFQGGPEWQEISRIMAELGLHSLPGGTGRVKRVLGWIAALLLAVVLIARCGPGGGDGGDDGALPGDSPVRGWQHAAAAPR